MSQSGRHNNVLGLLRENLPLHAAPIHPIRPIRKEIDPDHLGVILLIAGFLLKISILWTIGIILVVIGVILAILGATGHAIAGRRHFF